MLTRFRTEFIPATRFIVLFLGGMTLLGIVLRALAPAESLGWLYRSGFLNLYDRAPVLVWILISIFFFWIASKLLQGIWRHNDHARQLATLAAFDALTLESGDILRRENMGMGSAFSEIYLHYTPVKRKNDNRIVEVPTAMSVIRWNETNESLHLFYLGSRRHNVVGGYAPMTLSLPTDKQSALRVVTSMMVGALGGEAAGDLDGIGADVADAISDKAGEHAAEKVVPKKDWKLAGFQLALWLETTGGVAVCKLTTFNRMTGCYDSITEFPAEERRKLQQLMYFLGRIGINVVPAEQAETLDAQHHDSPQLNAGAEGLPGLPGELVRVTGRGELRKTTAARAQWVRRAVTLARTSLAAASAVMGSWLILTLLGGHAPLTAEGAQVLDLGSLFSWGAEKDALPASAGIFVVATSGASLNVRSEPNTNAPVLDKLANESSVLVCTRVNGWTQVVAGEQVGWVAARFLRKPTATLTAQQIARLTDHCDF